MHAGLKGVAQQKGSGVAGCNRFGRLNAHLACQPISSAAVRRWRASLPPCTLTAPPGSLLCAVAPPAAGSLLAPDAIRREHGEGPRRAVPPPRQPTHRQVRSARSTGCPTTTCTRRPTRGTTALLGITCPMPLW